METRDLLDRLDFIKAILIASCRLSRAPTAIGGWSRRGRRFRVGGGLLLICT